PRPHPAPHALPTPLQRKNPPPPADPRRRMPLRPPLHLRYRQTRGHRDLEPPLQLPSTPHRLWRPAPGLTPSHRRRQRHDQLHLVDAIVALPTKLFYNTGISVSLWFVSKDRHGNGHRERRGEVLFIDARKLGTLLSRKLRQLTDDDIEKVAGTYHAWRNHDGGYHDVPGFARAVSLDEISSHNYVLTPGRYVGTEEVDLDDEP